MNADERRSIGFSDLSACWVPSLRSPTPWAPDFSRKSTSGPCSENSAFAASALSPKLHSQSPTKATLPESTYLPRHGRRLKRFANPKPLDDTLPLDFRLLEIAQKTDGPAGDSLVVETLRSVLAGEPIYTFQLDDQHVFDEEICTVLSGRVAFVGDCE